MRVVAIVAVAVASGAWGVAAFAYAAWADIEGLSGSLEIWAGVGCAVVGIACVVAALRGGLAGHRARATSMLLLAAVAFLAWSQIAIPYN